MVLFYEIINSPIIMAGIMNVLVVILGGIGIAFFKRFFMKIFNNKFN